MGDSKTVVSAYTLYRHLQQYCSHQSIFPTGPVIAWYRLVVLKFSEAKLYLITKWVDQDQTVQTCSLILIYSFRHKHKNSRWYFLVHRSSIARFFLQNMTSRHNKGHCFFSIFFIPCRTEYISEFLRLDLNEFLISSRFLKNFSTE